MAPTNTTTTIDCDPWYLYRQSIEETALLNEQEERELGQRIERAKTEHQKAPHKQNVTVIEQGEEALHHLVQANMRLVMSIVQDQLHHQYGELSAMHLSDLMQEGSIGLMRAASKYDWRRGRFSTYATYWVRQAISRAIEQQAFQIRLPSWLHGELRRLRKERTRLVGVLGHEPSVDQLAEATAMNPERVTELLQASTTLVSLEQSCSANSEDLLLRDALVDQDLPVEEEAAEAARVSVIRERLQVLLKQLLTPREYLVIQLRFGFQNVHEHTLEEVGELLHVTRERVRQIEAKAIHKIAHCPAARELYERWCVDSDKLFSDPQEANEVA